MATKFYFRGFELHDPIIQRGRRSLLEMRLDCQAIRLVVQHGWRLPGGWSCYRLIGYSDEYTYWPVNRDSLDDLLKVLEEASEVLELGQTQRSILGLRKL